jgi:transcriptional regulator
MYVNPHFAERELPVLQDIIEDVRFGVLVICSDGPLAAHIPFVLHRHEGRFGTLVAHVSARDPLARHLDGAHEALAIFSAPRAYVSPRWCPSGGLPTYNFLAVHAYGRPRRLEDPDVVLGHLSELVQVHEERFSPQPWSLSAVAEDYVAERLPRIAAFSFQIDALQGKRKLSQNRTPEDRDGIVGGLRERALDGDLAIAETMAGYPYLAREG